MTQPDFTSLLNFALDIIKDASATSKMTFKIYAPKEVVQDPAILSDDIKVSSLKQTT